MVLHGIEIWCGSYGSYRPAEEGRTTDLEIEAM